MEFSLLYTIGSLLLAYYSITIRDWIFIGLNTGAALMGGISLIYKIIYK
ncbi:MAG: hypothetical protein V1703_03065 [Candidatus Altiarchaeota archaeon]